jgi:predicted GIY-YIG superfamily endonuclease
MEQKKGVMTMAKGRDTWLYELKHGRAIVYFGISRDPDRRLREQNISSKRFTHINVRSVALTRHTAEQRECDEIQRYQKQHCGQPLKYNIKKTY